MRVLQLIPEGFINKKFLGRSMRFWLPVVTITGLIAGIFSPLFDLSAIHGFTVKVYAQHGYCFKTARGISEIGNQGCYITNQAAVPLSHIEQLNIATIQRAERAKACPQ